MPFLQSVTATEVTGTGTYTSGAFASATRPGSLIVVSIVDDAGGATTAVTSVTDNNGSVYTKIGEQNGSATTLSMWVAFNITGRPGHTITVAYSTLTSTNNSLVAQEFNTVLAINALDKITKAKGTGTAVSSGAPAAPSQASNLIVASMVCDTTQVPTAGTNFSNLAQIGGGTPAVQVAQESRLISDGSAVAGTFTITTTNWGAIVASFGLESKPSIGASIRVGNGMSISEVAN